LGHYRYDRKEPVKLFVLDNDTKDGGILGLDFAEYLKNTIKDGVPVLMIAGFGEKGDYPSRAKELEKKRGFKYLGKPLDGEKINQFLEYVKNSLKL
jgi:DNA-binding NtrC family response regulator